MIRNSVEKTITFNRCFGFTIIASLLALGISYGIEFLGNSIPCRLCEYQRLPYAAMITGSILGIFLTKKNRLLNSIILLAVIGTSLGIFHALVQNEVISDPCKTEAVNTIDEFQLMLHQRKPCKTRDSNILGIPLSILNAIYSASLATILISIRRISKSNTTRKP